MPAFVPPKSTSYGTMGGNSFAVAVSSTVWTDSALGYDVFYGTMWYANGSLPQWIAWYNPEPILLTAIQIRNRNTSDAADACAPTQYYLQCSDDGNTWTNITDTVTNSIVEPNQWQSELVVPEANRDYHKYYRLYITARYSGSSYTAMQELKLTGVVDLATGPLEDWYGWQQPVSVLSNTSYGTITASSSLSGCDPYKAVDGVTSTESLGWATEDSAEGWWKWELPTTLKFRRLVFVNRNSETNDPNVLSQQCQFYIGNKSQRMGPLFSVSKSREYVTIDCGGLESNILYFYKLGGKNSGIGELIIDADEYKKTGYMACLKDIGKVRSDGFPVVQVYHMGELLWQDADAEVYETVQIPPFIDNFTFGALNSSTAADVAFHALDQSSDNSYMSTAAAPQWLSWDLPTDVLVKQITFKNNSSATGERTKTVQFFADEAMTIPLTEEFTAINEDFGETVITVPTIQTSKIYCYLKEGYGEQGLVGIGDIEIYARVKGTVPVLDYAQWEKVDLPLASDDCCMYDENEAIVAKISTNNPEPTVVPKEIDWVQPGFDSWSSNNNSTWDTSRYYTVSCDGSYTSSQTGRHILGGGWHTLTSNPPHWVGFYTPEIKVESFSFVVNGTTDYIPVEFQWDGSNDGAEWVTLGAFTRDASLTSRESYTIPEENRGFYQYHRLYITAGNRTFQYPGELQIVAKIMGEGLDYGAFSQLFDKDNTEIAWVSDEVDNWEDEIIGAYIPWTQPIFTSNTTWGTVSASSEGYPAYYALNGAYGGSSDYSNTWEAGGGSTAWWKWDFAEPLRISKIRVYQRAWSTSYYTSTVQIKTSAEGEELFSTTSMPQSVNGYLDFEFETPRTLESIYVYVTGSSYVGIGELELTAEIDGTTVKYPPYAEVEMLDPSSVLVNGITITNGDSAVKTFEWLVSNNGIEYTSLGRIQTPEFSWEPNSVCNVLTPNPDLSVFKYHRFVVRELVDNASIVSMKELTLNVYKRV